MELRQLRYFIALSKELNFSRAADKLNISQPTLSQQIAAMEAEMGGPLLQRSKRSVKLTDAGRTMLEYGEDLLYQFDCLVGRIQRMNNTAREVPALTIGVDTNDHDLDRWDIIRAITGIHRAIPQAEFRFVTVPFKSVRSAIINRDIDVGFYTLPKGSEKKLDIHYKILRHDRISLGVPETYFDGNPDAGIADVLRTLPVCLLAGDIRWNSYFESVLRRYQEELNILYFESDGLLFDYISASLGVYLNTRTLFDMHGPNMKGRFQIREIPLSDEDVGAVEIAAWDESCPNDLRDMLFDIIKY